MMVEVLVSAEVVEFSLMMILCQKYVHYQHFLKRRNGHTDGRTDVRTDPLIEMRGRI